MATLKAHLSACDAQAEGLLFPRTHACRPCSLTAKALALLLLLGGLLIGPTVLAPPPAQAQELFVSSGGTHQVLRYGGTTGTFIDAFVTAGSGGLNNPIGLAFGPDGNLYVASVFTNQVLRYGGTTGAFIDAFVTAGLGGLTNPQGLVFGPDGNLYVSNPSTNQVLRYGGTTGAFIDAFVTAGSGGLTNPVALVFRSSADIPTLSEWAQIGMVALLVGGGLLAIRKRSAFGNQRSA